MAEHSIPASKHFLLRLTRGGPLVPARLRWLDHAQWDPPDNKLDRGRLSIYPAADIAGEDVQPEQLTDRLISLDDPRPAQPPTHWRYAIPITELEYRYHFDRLRWAERNRQHDPALKPRKRLDPAQMTLPSFDRENSL